MNQSLIAMVCRKECAGQPVKFVLRFLLLSNIRQNKPVFESITAQYSINANSLNHRVILSAGVVNPIMQKLDINACRPFHGNNIFKNRLEYRDIFRIYKILKTIPL